MVFTVEDFRKIQLWLELNGVKDTEFEGVDIPFKGDEIIAIVQDGKNVQVPIMQFISQVVGLGGGMIPDEEDLTISQGGLVKFKDKNAVSSVDKGYKVLRERPGNILTSSDLRAETIHEIRYRFDLGGAGLVIPLGAEFYFKGGSIYNGHIVFGPENRPTKIHGALGPITDYIGSSTYEGYYLMPGSYINDGGDGGYGSLRDLVIDILVNDIEWDADASAVDLPGGPTANVDLEVTDV